MSTTTSRQPSLTADAPIYDADPARSTLEHPIHLVQHLAEFGPRRRQLHQLCLDLGLLLRKVSVGAEEPGDLVAG